jgi:hypothetical protein
VTHLKSDLFVPLSTAQNTGDVIRIFGGEGWGAEATGCVVKNHFRSLGEGGTPKSLRIIVLRFRDANAREQVDHHLCNSGERVSSSRFELNTADWDPGLWEEEVRRLENMLLGTDDLILVWKFSGQTYTRFTFRGS